MLVPVGVANPYLEDCCFLKMNYCVGGQRTFGDKDHDFPCREVSSIVLAGRYLMLAQGTVLFNSWDTAGVWTAADAAGVSSEQIIDLTAGDIWSDVPRSVREGAIAAIDRRLDHHTDTVNLTQLRNALARKISAETDQGWSADEIAVTRGAKQALLNAGPGSSGIQGTKY